MATGDRDRLIAEPAATTSLVTAPDPKEPGRVGSRGQAAQSTIMIRIVERLTSYLRRYRTTPTSIWVRQDHGWVELRRDTIAAVKFESVSRGIVRYYNGQRIVVSLFRPSTRAYEAVCRWLEAALRENETRGLWGGAQRPPGHGPPGQRR